MLNRILGSLAGVALTAIAATALAQSNAPDTPPAVKPAPTPPGTSTLEWVRRPNGDDKDRVYPPAARTAHIGGEVVLSCGITAAGTMANCLVISETPDGQKFGEAALRLTPLFRVKPMTREGWPVEGGVVKFPIKFTPPE